MAVVHVSHPCIRTDFMFELNSVIVVLAEILFAFHSFCTRVHAILAFTVLALMSASIPPFLPMMLPLYVMAYSLSPEASSLRDTIPIFNILSPWEIHFTQFLLSSKTCEFEWLL